MRTFYFDYKILAGEAMDAEERKLRQNLQRGISARETLRELGMRRGLYGVARSRKENIKSR